MYHVIFQVQPSICGYQAYLDTAAKLRPQLDNINGFMSIERFRSLDRGRWLLSLSEWADEASLVKWRTSADHHDAQKIGRGGVFDDYRLRVAQVVMRAQSYQPEWAPERRTSYRVAQGPARFVSVLEIAGVDRAAFKPVGDASDSEWYESLVNPQKRAWVIGWNDEPTARNWHSETRAMLDFEEAAFELSLVELERDYGLFAREEAPQFYPPVKRPASD